MGDFPVITTVADDITSENIEDVYEQYFPAQNTELEAYQQIEKDLLAAIQHAPDNTAGNKTLFTKSVARTLLAKIYAEKPLRDYSKVIRYCDEVKADGFELVKDFSDLFGMKLPERMQKSVILKNLYWKLSLLPVRVTGVHGCSDVTL